LVLNVNQQILKRKSNSLILKSYKDFINEAKQDQWIYEGDFKATEDMVQDGKLIKDKIPDIVKGNFYCYHNQLTSLEGAPEKVGGNFVCNDNQLKSLEGGPEQVGDTFWCDYNQLTNLEGAPEKVGEDFWCHNNQLTSLQGAPEQVGGYFDCNRNKLTTLEGAPKKVGGDFDSRNNKVNLAIEEEFIESGSYQDNYWIDLLKYMLKENIPLEKVEGWPDGFLTDNLKKSAKGTVKYKL